MKTMCYGKTNLGFVISDPELTNYEVCVTIGKHEQVTFPDKMNTIHIFAFGSTIHRDKKFF